MKRVFSSAQEVIHLWAAQAQSEARAGNVYFKGDTIYSYGHHFPAARIHTLKNGRQLVIKRYDTYSPTTAGHLSSIRGGVSHLPTLEATGQVDNILLALSENADRVTEAYFDRLLIIKWRSWPKTVDEAFTDAFKGWHDTVIEHNKICDMVDAPKKLRITIPDDAMSVWLEHFETLKRRYDLSMTDEAKAKREKERLKRQAAKQAKILRDNEENIKEWRAFRRDYLHGIRPQLIRVGTRVDNGAQEVQTSLGARVPLDEALKLLDYVERAHKANVNVFDVKCGPYSATSFDGSIVKIGCHAISIDEARTVLAPYISKE